MNLFFKCNKINGQTSETVVSNVGNGFQQKRKQFVSTEWEHRLLHNSHNCWVIINKELKIGLSGADMRLIEMEVVLAAVDAPHSLCTDRVTRKERGILGNGVNIDIRLSTQSTQSLTTNERQNNRNHWKTDPNNS